MMSLREEYFLFVKGNTDSEWAFAVFLNELANLGCTPSQQNPGGFGHAMLRTAMMNTIFAINNWCKEAGEKEPSLLNFAVTDGEAVVASRYVSSATHEAASLFFRFGVLPTFVTRITDGSSGTSFHQYAPGHFRMERRDKGQDIVLVASEPLTFERADWVTVPSNCKAFIWLYADRSHFDDKWPDSIVASHCWFVFWCLSDTYYLDEHYIADPLHTRRNGFAESKGQSSVVAAC